MALTKSPAAVAMQASAGNAAGATTTSASQPIGYGLGIIAQVTNGGTGPTVGCDVVLLVSADNATFYEADRRTAGVTASGVYRFPFNLGVAGSGGDWAYAQVQFTGNTGQPVTVQAYASSTTAL